MKPRIVLSILPVVIVLLIIVLLARGLHLNPHELPLETQGRLVSSVLLDELEPLLEEEYPGWQEGVKLIHFWASWCSVCHQEHRVLMDLKRSGVPIIGVAYKDDQKEIIRMLETKGNPFVLNYSDPRGLFGLEVGLYSVPETYIVDENGGVQYRLAGPLTMQSYEKKIKPVFEALNRAYQDAQTV